MVYNNIISTTIRSSDVTCPKCKEIRQYYTDAPNGPSEFAKLCPRCWVKFQYGDIVGHGFAPEFNLYVVLLDADNYELAAKILEDWING